jgi:hypothetical protein
MEYLTTIRQRFSSYKSRVEHGQERARGLVFELTFEQFTHLVTQPCHYCGALPENGVDRLEASVGYTLSNCVPCCQPCNAKKTAREHVCPKCRHVFTAPF